MADSLKKMKIIIVVLTVLLGISLTMLVGVIVCGQLDPSNGSAVVSDNYIEPTGSSELNMSANAVYIRPTPAVLCTFGPGVRLSRGIVTMASAKTIITSDSAKETVISIYRNHAEDSTPFHLSNMFPGDAEEKVYLLEVSHEGTVTVRFHADIREGYEKLAEVLRCKVALRGESTPLYEGLMRDMPESIDHRITSATGKTTDLIYDITVCLDTSVGNEYMNKELVADFRWWVEESGGNAPDIPGDPDDTTEPDDGGLINPPSTGDYSHIHTWLWIAMISLAAVVLLLWSKRRKNNDGQEDLSTNG